jgi:phosphopantothenoylcysteine synthetase/decarboxylase
VTFLITAGPTREPIDPVRYISNRSSGKMGYAIAGAALDAGHDVILISGPTNLMPPCNAKLVSVSTSDEMFEAVHRYANESDVCVLCAAVADYKPAHVSPVKSKVRRRNFNCISSHARHSPVVRPTTGSQISSRWFRRGNGSPRGKRHEKLREKNCDIIVATMRIRNGKRRK